MNMNIGKSNQFFTRGSYTKAKFSKNKVVTDKTPFFVIDPYCTPYSMCVNIGLGRAVLYGNISFSILILPTKKRYSSFLKKVLFFWRKFVSKLKHWKRSKSHWFSYKNKPICQTEGHFENPYYWFLEESMLFYWL